MKNHMKTVSKFSFHFFQITCGMVARQGQSKTTLKIKV